MATDAKDRLDVLDGWRGISILLVLAAHLLPLGPKSWRFNEMAGPMGMALFFTLSGFLITRFLLHHDSVVDFLIRRFFRIVPLTWLALLVALPLSGAPGSTYLPNFLFYANLPPYHLAEVADHFWSLCVEAQFYAAVAIIVAVLRQARAVPADRDLRRRHRASCRQSGAEIEIVTWHRVDEILAGAILALVYAGRLGALRDGAVSLRGSVYVLLAAVRGVLPPGERFRQLPSALPRGRARRARRSTARRRASAQC